MKISLRTPAIVVAAAAAGAAGALLVAARRSRNRQQPGRAEPRTPSGGLKAPRASFGDPAVQQDFFDRHRLFVEFAMPPLERLINELLQVMKAPSRDGKVIYALASQVFEDLGEILCLCFNGYSTGAQKILRGTFERTVTLVYLTQHPEKIQDFIDYWHIASRKKREQAKRLHKGVMFDDIEEPITEEEFEAIKKRFMVPACRDCAKLAKRHPEKADHYCQHERPNFSWTTLDVPSMASSTGVGMSFLTVMGYYQPMEETHATFASILKRFRPGAAGTGIDYVEGARLDLDRNTVLFAHYFAIKAAEAAKHFFEIPDSALPSWQEALEAADRHIRSLKREPEARPDAP